MTTCRPKKTIVFVVILYHGSAFLYQCKFLKQCDKQHAMKISFRITQKMALLIQSLNVTWAV